MQQGQALQEEPREIDARVAHYHGEAVIVPDHVGQDLARQLVELWFKKSIETGAIDSDWEPTGIMVWPQTPDDWPAIGDFNTPAQHDYMELQDDICDRLFARIKPMVILAFQEVADEVFAEYRADAEAWRQR